MKPDEVISELKRWGLNVTRRTLLRYEKESLIPEPYLRTGKATEYPSSVVADFFASFYLIHGDYRLKPEKCREVRKKALNILYNFHEKGQEVLPSIKAYGDLIQFISANENKNLIVPIDVFVYEWLVARQTILTPLKHIEPSEDYDGFRDRIIAIAADYYFRDTKDINQTIPKVWAFTLAEYNNSFVFGEAIVPEGIKDEYSKTYILIRLYNKTYNKKTAIKFLHPDDYYNIRPY